MKQVFDVPIFVSTRDSLPYSSNL